MGEFDRLRAGLRAAAPSVVLVLAVVLLAVPLRLFQGYLPTPLLPLLIVFLHGLYDPDALPAPVIFACGLLADVLEGDALGPWASVYLLVSWLITSQRTYFLGRARDVVWLGFAVALTIGMVVHWLEVSLLTGRFVSILPALAQYGLTLLVYPLAAYAFFGLRARAGVREEWAV